jgi:ribosomal protein S18 acetylase RimI-like enzyme
MQIKISVPYGSCLGTIYNNGQAWIMVIDSVEVDKNQRRRGIGTALMTKAIEVAKEYNIDSIELIVNDYNEAAKELYKKVGFLKTNKEHYRIILKHFDL